MFDAIEIWARDYQFSIAAISAISTALAVVVSLGIALHSARGTRTKLRAAINQSTIIHETIEDSPLYITVSITNTGTFPLRIPRFYFFWKVPFQRHLFLITVMDAGQHDPLVPVQQYPITLDPRTSASLFLSPYETFRTVIADMKQQLPWHGKLLFRLISANITTDDGAVFKAQISKEIRHDLRSIKAAPDPRRAAVAQT